MWVYSENKMKKKWFYFFFGKKNNNQTSFVLELDPLWFSMKTKSTVIGAPFCFILQINKLIPLYRKKNETFNYNRLRSNFHQKNYFHNITKNIYFSTITYKILQPQALTTSPKISAHTVLLNSRLNRISPKIN